MVSIYYQIPVRKETRVALEKKQKELKNRYGEGTFKNKRYRITFDDTVKFLLAADDNNKRHNGHTFEYTDDLFYLILGRFPWSYPRPDKLKHAIIPNAKTPTHHLKGGETLYL